MDSCHVLTDYTQIVDDVITRDREINLCKNHVLANSLYTASQNSCHSYGRFIHTESLYNLRSLLL